MSENQVEKFMRLLNISEAEAKQLVEDDKAIDKGQRMPFDLSKEEEKAAKKFANVTTKKQPTVYKFEKKHKENPTKAALIAKIAEFLKQNGENLCENVKITNKERQISFSIADENFELTLVQKRKIKN